MAGNPPEDRGGKRGGFFGRFRGPKSPDSYAAKYGPNAKPKKKGR